jgi:hypothetical protein
VLVLQSRKVLQKVLEQHLPKVSQMAMEMRF